MKSNGFLLLIAGLMVIYIGLSGKYPIFERFIRDLFSDVVEPLGTPKGKSSTTSANVAQTQLPNVFTGGVPGLRDVLSSYGG